MLGSLGKPVGAMQVLAVPGALVWLEQLLQGGPVSVVTELFLLVPFV